ncbi:MAG: EAL domain-containing protein [Candidatus Competibacter sp.]|nr:EAL domain-containing protein [Candidatus Competibacter sp.]
MDLAVWCLHQGQTIKLPEHSLLVGHSGREYAIRASAAPIRDERGQILGTVLAISDLSEARRLTEQMAYQATYDALTELPNRNLLRDRLRHAIVHAQRTTQGFALLLVDLDHFKKVNESMGHTVGDLLLQGVAVRLRNCGRKADTLARLGSDEFVMVLEDLQQEDWVILFARNILKILEPPFLLKNQECYITASIGVCLFPRDGEDAETLLKNADSALYRAKENGRSTVQCYAQDMHVRAVERLRMEGNLRHALERQEFELHYQPQLDLRQRRIVGVEALLRWRDAGRDLIPPTDFIPLAEETGLIETIGEWVLRTACAQAKAWRREGLPALRMAVNLSPRQFLRPGLVDLVATVLRETGLEAGCLDLEITEGLLMRDVEGNIATLRQLKTMGVRLSIDDFGTGYSSLSYLKRFPIDQLKIDQSFVRDVVTDQDDTAIVLAVIAMAHSMQLEVVAEGVETKEQLAFLRANQCDVMQGYYLSRPAPPHQIATLLREAKA